MQEINQMKTTKYLEMPVPNKKSYSVIVFKYD